MLSAGRVEGGAEGGKHAADFQATGVELSVFSFGQVSEVGGEVELTLGLAIDPRAMVTKRRNSGRV